MDSTPYIEKSNLFYVISPKYGHQDDGVHRFRWHCHFPLQHPLPSNKCACRTITMPQRSYLMGVHNHLDRLTYCDAESPGLPKTALIDKSAKHPAGSQRQVLRSVATFEEKHDFPTVDLAFEDAQAKVTECIGALRSFLIDCQRHAPFSCAWLLMPPTLYDLGGIVHSVLRECPTSKVRTTYCSWPAFSVGKHAQNPLFLMDLPDAATHLDPALNLPYELLAEANAAICREMPRVAVFNAYAAVEIFAVAVYRRLKTAALIKSGESDSKASDLVGEELRKARDQMKLLLNTGIKEITGHSLYCEDATKYDAFFKAKELRNRVCHDGLIASTKDAEELFKLCCEVIQWLGGVAGIAVKPFFPAKSDLQEKLSFTFGHCPQI